MFKSLKDVAYQGCISSEKGIAIGQALLEACPSFLTSIPEEITAQLVDGQMVRFNELHPAQYYTKDWVPCEVGTKGSTKVDVHIVMSFSQQEFGKFKSDDVLKYGIHKPWRDDWSTYKSNRMKELKNHVKKYIAFKENKPRERAVTKDFSVWLKEDWLVTLKDRAKTAKSRGDVTVDENIINAIIKASK
jgi:hypothetical protein